MARPQKEGMDYFPHDTDATRMIREIKEATGITPKTATPGLEVELELYPY